MAKNTKALVIDTETTGVDPEAQATEIGWCESSFDANGILQHHDGAYVKRCKPEREVSLSSMAITHIYPEDLVQERPHYEVIPEVINDSYEYVIGHKIDYDMNIIKNAGVTVNPKRICTLALSRNLYPNAESHNLSYMLHLLDYEFARMHSHKAHSAKHDVIFCFRILRIICEQHNISNMHELWELSEKCRIPKYMPFGKHKGKLISDIDDGYKKYMLDKLDDEHLKTAFLNSLSHNKSKASC